MVKAMEQDGDGSRNLWIRWSIENSHSNLHYYRDVYAKPVTEKSITFALTSFEREICSRLSVLETLQGGYDYFCYTSKVDLHNIIEAYMEA